MHGELLRAIDIPAGGATVNHSYKKVFLQYCGAEREATLREPYMNANYQVQSLRQFVCELEQLSQVRKLNIVTHLRSESQLDQLEGLKGAQQRIVIGYQFSASFHEREFVLGSTHVVVCDRGLDMYTAMRRGMRRTRQCRVLYFVVLGNFNAADRAANLPVYAPFTPLVRIPEERPAPSTPEKLPERGQKQGVVDAKLEPEREPKVVCNSSCEHVAPRKNEVKQQQDWRLVFVDRPETEQITDYLDDFLFGVNIGFDLRAGACPKSAPRFRVQTRAVRSGNSHVTSRPVSFPPHPIPGGTPSSSIGMPSRREGPPSIWDTHGNSETFFVNPDTSSSAHYPQELNQWSSSIEEPLHSSTVDKSERRTQDKDQRCQSGPSAKDSVIFSGGDYSKNYGADQQRLQISDLHFYNFPTPATFACWKIRFKTGVCTCSQFPTEAMQWIKEVEKVDSVEELRSSSSTRGISMPNFEVLDARIAVKSISPVQENSMQYGYDENDNNNMSDETKCETNYSINNKGNNTRNKHLTKHDTNDDVDLDNCVVHTVR